MNHKVTKVLQLSFQNGYNKIPKKRSNCMKLKTQNAGSNNPINVTLVFFWL